MPEEELNNLALHECLQQAAALIRLAEQQLPSINNKINL